MSSLLSFSGDVNALRQSLRQRILTVTPESFDSLALAVFRYQAAYNSVYRQYLHHLNVRPDRITDLRRVPFMPISFFKSHIVLTGSEPGQGAALTFASSGTTGLTTSRHLVPDPDLYDAVSTRIFEETYGPLQNVHILALLPSYLERNNSSLVYMVQRFMSRSGSVHNGFFLNDHDALTDRLRQLTEMTDSGGGSHLKILLIGVTFGLLDWAESAGDLTFLKHNPNLIVMETGGMKGRRKELLREEVHELLTSRLGVSAIHSEYGMTELLSQAYSTGNGVFSPSPTLRVLLRDINDPFSLYSAGETPAGTRQTGGINVIDLANLDSCSFIETQDLGRFVDSQLPASMVATPDVSTAPADRLDVFTRDRFLVIGRFDNSDVRGCNLMIISH